jgi:hypothetical protein
MELTAEQQEVYDSLSPEKQAYYAGVFEEAARIEALPLEEKVQMLMQRVGELIVIVQQHQREFEALGAILDMMMPKREAAPMPPATESFPMPGQYL